MNGKAVFWVVLIAFIVICNLMAKGCSGLFDFVSGVGSACFWPVAIALVIAVLIGWGKK